MAAIADKAGGAFLFFVPITYKLKYENVTRLLLTVVMPRFLLRNMIRTTLKYIEEQIGLKLQLCDYFTGIQESNGNEYFNIILPQRTSESKEYAQLVRFSDKFKTIIVEPNGLKRVAIFLNGA